MLSKAPIALSPVPTDDFWL